MNSRIGGTAAAVMTQRNHMVELGFPETVTKTLRSAYAEVAVVSSDATTPIYLNMALNQDSILATSTGSRTYVIDSSEDMSFYNLVDASSTVSVTSTAATYVLNMINDATAAFSPKFVVTYDVAYPATPVVDQHEYIWRDDSTAINTYGGWLAPTSTATTTNLGNVIRLRAEIANTSNATDSNGYYQIEFANKVGISCGDDETYSAVPTSTYSQAFTMATSTQYSNATTVSASYLPPTGTFSTSTGTGVAYPGNITSAFTLMGGKYTEFEYAIISNSYVTSTQSFCFRLTDNGTTTGFNYTVNPEIQVLPPSAVITQRAYVFQNDDGANVNSNSTTSGANTTSTEIYKGQRIIARFQIDETNGAEETSAYKLQYDKDLDARWTDVAPGGAPSSNSGANFGDWNATTVDSGGDVGNYTSSIAIGADGLPVISYYNTTNGDLLFAKCNNTVCSSVNTTTVQTSDDVGEYSSIAIGTDGLPVISYFGSTNGDLLFAKCTANPCTTATNWSTTTVQTAGTVGQYTSLAIGTDGLPVISYMDFNTSFNYKLLFAKCTANPCTTATNWSTTTVETAGDTGYNSSIAIGTDGYPVISYREGIGLDLRFAKCTANPCTTATNWSTTTVQTAGTVGQYTSLAIGNDGLPVISYYDNTNKDLLVAKCTTGDCTSAGNWTTSTVDSSGTVGQYTSLAIGTDGLPIISYYASTTGTNYGLRVAKCGNNSCNASTSPATTYTIDTSAANVGQYTSITIAPDGWPVVSYYDVTNGDLKVAKMLPITEIQPSWGLSGTSSDPLTATSTGACTPNTTWVNGAWFEGTAVSTLTTINNQCTELAFMLDTSEAVASTTYRLRLVESDGDVLNAYAKYPALRIISEAQNIKRYSKEAIMTSANTASSSVWNVAQLDTAGYYTSLAIGTDGYPVIGYVGPGNILKVIKCSNSSCTSFSSTTVDTAGYYTSLAIGTDGYPVISYQGPGNALKVAKCSNVACTQSSSTTLDTYSVNISIAIGTDGYPVISYRGPSPFPLNVIKCSNSSCTSFSSTTLDTAGSDASIAIGTDGYPVISYRGPSPFPLNVIKCSNSSCTSFSSTTLDTGGYETSIAIGTDGYPVISYRGPSDKPKVIKCSNSSCTSFSSTTVDTANGYYPSLAIGTDGYPVIGYVGPGNILKVIKCSNSSCTSFSSTTVDTGGYYASIAIGTDGYPVISYATGSGGFINVAKQLGLPKTAISYFNNYIKTDRQIKLTRNQWTDATTGAMWLESSPAIEDGLTYWFDKKDYTNASTSGDSASTSISSSGAAFATTTPVFEFADNFRATTTFQATWTGQSTVGALANPIYLQIFRFGSSSSTTGWFTIASSTSCTANNNCTIQSTAFSENVSDYFYPYYNFNDSTGTTTPEFWTFCRVYQDASTTINLKTDYWNIGYSAPVIPTITISGTAYADEGTTSIGVSRVVRIKIQGAGDYSGDTLSDGTYSITGYNYQRGRGYCYCYLDAATSTEKANTITIASTTTDDHYRTEPLPE